MLAVIGGLQADALIDCCAGDRVYGSISDWGAAGVAARGLDEAARGAAAGCGVI